MTNEKIKILAAVELLRKDIKKLPDLESQIHAQQCIITILRAVSTMEEK